jgi:hypothetical protein
MPTRKSTIFFAFVLFCTAALFLMFAHAGYLEATYLPARDQKARMVERLELTDLCLFIDARYARHPSMADLHTAFQDSPMAMEHFPSGTLILPPPHLRPR